MHKIGGNLSFPYKETNITTKTNFSSSAEKDVVDLNKRVYLIPLND